MREMVSPRTTTFGDLLRRYRIAAGLTQNQLAEQAGLSLRGVSDLERGLKLRPRQSTIDLLVTALELGPAEQTLLKAAVRRPVAPSRHKPGGVLVVLPRASGDIRAKLPIPLTSFIGRQAEIAEVRRLLVSSRLLTLAGSGGVGKTRLALEVAAQVVGEYADGVGLVELAPLADPTLVPKTVAGALAIPEQSSRPVRDLLVDVLRPKQLLLVLDNCEHLVQACADLVEILLHACPDLRILATSRQSLSVPGETTWRVPSLALPPPESLSPGETLAHFDATRLFVERATAVLPSFAISSASGPLIARICRRLDGIPLAIELAAARIAVLSLEQIDRRLDDRLRLLTGGGRTALPRQQTLRATLDWSYALLSEPERVLFRRLAVFSGGFTLEAAEAVGGGDGIATEEVLDRFTGLVDKSVVLVEERDEEARYRLLETLREYAREKLDERGETRSVAERHAHYYLRLAEEAEPRLDGTDEVEWLDRLDREHDNLRAAVAWGEAEDESGETGLRLAAALGLFWKERGHLTEGLHWLGRVLGKSGRALPALRAKALIGAGHVAVYQGDHDRARSFYEESLEIGRETRQKPVIARSLCGLGMVAQSFGDWAAARSFFEEGLAVARDAGQRPVIALLLDGLANVALRRGDPAAARSFFEESLEIRREVGDRGGIPRSLTGLGEVARGQGDLDRARALYQESLTFARDTGQKQLIADLTYVLGDVARGQGDLDGARARYQESLALGREIGQRPRIAWSLYGLGDVAWARGDLDGARVHYEESLALGREIGHRPVIAWLLYGLGEAAWARGELTRARSAFRESLGIGREMGQKDVVGWSLFGLGDVDRGEGELDAARARFEESLAVGREIESKQLIAWSLISLADVARAQGELDAARARYRDSQAIRWGPGDRRGLAKWLEGLAAGAEMDGRLPRSARLSGASEALRAAFGAPWPPADRASYRRTVDAARAGLGEARFAALAAEGRSMALDEVVAYALSANDVESGLRNPTETYAAGPTCSPLTPRERDVAVLIARGLSNREIATALVITPRTADTQVRNILAKLELHSRASVAAWAVEHGLLTGPAKEDT